MTCSLRVGKRDYHGEHTSSTRERINIEADPRFLEGFHSRIPAAARRSRVAENGFDILYSVTFAEPIGKKGLKGPDLKLVARVFRSSCLSLSYTARR